MYSLNELIFLKLFILLLNSLQFSTNFINNQNDWVNDTIEQIDNFTLYQIMSIEKHVVVYFYDYGHKQESVYKLLSEMSNKVRETMLPISVFTVCVTYFDDVIQKLNIYSPSVTYFRDGGQYKYEYKEAMKINKNRTNPIYEWIRLKIGSPMKLLRNIKETEEFVSNNNLIAIMFMKETNQKILKNLSIVAEHVDHIAYGLVYDKIIFNHFI
uniref:SJCHGC08534 protein n=1 Tax=Schistosoma japonicum TaxID=6182 RepID=Q5DAS6_SCHJA|nr:SJCHGC08534 protein [Schistosoma japonicum]